MSDDKPIPVNLPDGVDESSMDEFRRENSSIFETRRWVQDALENHGARVTGAGCGMGEADIDIEIGSERFNIVIKPIRPAERTQ
jgi:hypothetical protein